MATINIRVDEDVKKQASALFADLGLDISAAVNMFLRQAIMRDGIPFEVRRIPNAETKAALEEVPAPEKGPSVTGKLVGVLKGPICEDPD